MEWKNSNDWERADAKASGRRKEITNFEIKVEGAQIKWNQDKGAEETNTSSYNWINSKKISSGRIDRFEIV